MMQKQTRRALAGLCLAVLSLGVMACSQPATPLPAAQATAVQVQAGKDQFVAGVKNMLAQPFRAQTNRTAPDGKTQTATIEWAPPDKMHILTGNIDAVMAAGTQQGFRKDAGGKYVPLDDMNTQALVRLVQYFLPQWQAGVIQAFNTGKAVALPSETIDGANMTVARYSVSVGDQGVATQTLWIASSDGLPRKIETVAADQTKTTTTIVYDPNIKIEMPAS